MTGSFNAQDFLDRGRDRFQSGIGEEVFDLTRPVSTGDDLRPFKGSDKAGLITDPEKIRLASVLVPLLQKNGDLHILMTKRSDGLSDHAGQISFPGGKIEAGETPQDTALREAREEVGIDERFVEPLGFLPAYQTFTGFRIIPVIGLVQGGYRLQAERGEVDEIFDVPLSFLMDVSNHQKHKVENTSMTRHYYAISYEDYFIWGATAGIIRQLYMQVYQT